MAALNEIIIYTSWVCMCGDGDAVAGGNIAMSKHHIKL